MTTDNSEDITAETSTNGVDIEMPPAAEILEKNGPEASIVESDAPEGDPEDNLESTTVYTLINEVEIRIPLVAETLEQAKTEAAGIVEADARYERSLSTYWIDVGIEWDEDDGWSARDVLAVQVDPLPPPCREEGGQHEWEWYDRDEHDIDECPGLIISAKFKPAMLVDESETEVCECGWARHTFRFVKRPDGGEGVYDAIEYVRWKR